MGYYFDDNKSVFYHFGQAKIEETLKIVSERYINTNPEKPYSLRPYSLEGILRNEEYRYSVDFNNIFPQAKQEQYIYAWGTYKSEIDKTLRFDLTPFCPITVFCNGEQIYQTDIFTERYHDSRISISVQIKNGTNHLILRFKKTKAGFGGIFGTWLGKLDYYFLMPGKRSVQEGFLFSEPLAKIYREIEGISSIPEDADIRKLTNLKWFPKNVYANDKANKLNLERIFGLEKGRKAAAKSMINLPGNGTREYLITGKNSGVLEIYIDGELVYGPEIAGEIKTPVNIKSGTRNILVVSSCPEEEWGFDIKISLDGEQLKFENPWLIDKDNCPWLYAGPFSGGARISPEIFDNPDKLIDASGTPTYWRLDIPSGWARLYNENPLFGHWNYPLGVTLYGLLQTSRELNMPELKEYVRKHIQKSIDTFDYALWDKQKFGGATATHHLLTSLDSLDDCGSFGSLLLEAAGPCGLKNFRKIADFVGEYISKKQIRLPDGTFYRKNLMHQFHEDTLWADDLYMSVPFLCRYSKLTGYPSYLEDAASQFLGFKKRLYIPELKVMSHIYDFKHEMANDIPWGRGNGWVIFSLSELLTYLPIEHEYRPELIKLFIDLSEGVLALQDEQGMWRQLLNDQTSYPETSCTAMFIYGFSKAVLMGLYEDSRPYIESCYKAWEALTKTSIDDKGNIYGVCRGSEFSFSPEYYKKELSHRLNDTHGIGIILLAGSELLKVKNAVK